MSVETADNEVETADNEDAAGLEASYDLSFIARFGIVNFESKLAATGLDGASVNVGRNTGLAARLNEIAPWLTAHCRPLRQLLKKNGCDVSCDTMLAEWSALKLLISETYGKAIPYLDVWAAILSSPAGKEQFSNILNIVELLLITPICG